LAGSENYWALSHSGKHSISKPRPPSSKKNAIFLDSWRNNNIPENKPQKILKIIRKSKRAKTRADMFLFNLIFSELQLLYKLPLEGGCVIEPVSLGCSESRSMDSVLAS
jgi:hypothetical protein